MFSFKDEGYSSGHSSDTGHPEVFFTRPHLKFLNRQLQILEPQDILRWCITTLPGLYQTSAMGLTGLAMTDMLSKLRMQRSQQVDLIFLDTMYHFSETLALVERVRQRYPFKNFNIFKPADVATTEEFENKYGKELWKKNDTQYDFVAKVEPAQRAYQELGVNAILTGRRRSQGAKRGDLDIIEVDEAGLIKVNPLANWSFDQVQNYIKENNVPYNELLDRGYKSVGDWHSTQPITEGEEERSGRWKGQIKTECGIHNPRSRYGQILRQKALEAQAKAQQEAVSKFGEVEA